MNFLIRILPFLGLVVAAGIWAISVWRNEPVGFLPPILAVLSSIEIGRRAIFHQTAKSRVPQTGSPEHETAMAFAAFVMVFCACAGPTIVFLGLYFFRGEHLGKVLLIGGGLFAFPFIMSRPISYLIDRIFRK